MAQQKPSAKKATKAPAKKAQARKPAKGLTMKKPAKAPKPVPVVAKAASGNRQPVDPKPSKGKVSSGLSKSDIQYFRNLLLEKRRELLGDVGSMESEAFKQGSNLSNMPIHMADVGTDNYEQEFTLGLIESERQMLREIQEALVRLDEGNYGICVGTGKAIGRVRLEALPWTKYSKEYSQALESGQIRRDMARDDDDDAGEEEEE